LVTWQLEASSRKRRCARFAQRAFNLRQKLKQSQNDSFERRHPEIELAKQNEIALKLERQQDAQLIPPL